MAIFSLIAGGHIAAYNAGRTSIIVKSLEKDKARSEKNEKGGKEVTGYYKTFYKTLPTTSTYGCSPNVRDVIERLPVGQSTKPTY